MLAVQAIRVNTMNRPSHGYVIVWLREVVIEAEGTVKTQPLSYQLIM